jgi:hypothetical protein
VAKAKKSRGKHPDDNLPGKEAPILVLRRTKSGGSLTQPSRLEDRVERHPRDKLKTGVIPIKAEELSEKDVIVA